MPSVFDVAAYILKKCGPMTHMKLQKLVYYAQAWSLVWDEAPLFEAPIEAWVNGPVVRRLFGWLRSKYIVDAGDIHDEYGEENLTQTQRETIDAICVHYGDKSPQWLSDLTHAEEPWQKARRGLKPGERGTREIKRADMAWYYGSLK